MVWLEINDDLIMGVHTDKCESNLLWIEYEGEANPGDYWKANKVISSKKSVDAAIEKQIAARAHITRLYPEWKQLNIIRGGDEKEIARMGRYIDATRNWSNRRNSSLSQLEKITP